MTDWDIVKDIVVLAGLIITVTTPLLKLNTSITQLKALLDSVAKQVQENDKSNRAINGCGSTTKNKMKRCNGMSSVCTIWTESEVQLYG